MNVRDPLISASVAGVAALVVFGATGCASDEAVGDDGRVDATTTLYPLQYVTERVGGTHVKVTNLVKPGAEPHDLELSARQTGELGDADLVVYLKGLQPAVDEAVEQAGVDHVAEATEYSALVEHEGEEHGDEEGGHDHDHGDPHIWLDPTRLAKVAEGVRDELSDVDPDHADDYRANAATLVKELKALDREFQEGLATVQNRTFVTTHSAFGYLAERYHLKQVAINGVNPEAEPSPARLADLEETVKDEKVTTIFFESQASPKTAKTLAKDLGLRTAVLNPLESVSDPEKSTYFTVMRQNLKELRVALEAS
ncbi:ABC transporter substrate-binding protein [Wenjunlia vitaminophila]|uniref:ABC transporter substrate-binding protein n=1 Tax=Wenjunlia vitaminophila TaxID=76728 RepID=A0A0T6LK96_WENVI|nr:metal ABC transporter substrate-binding protein [Wenjunlia vitaminophila]KRV46440.1 ABC transporter substrate-binding protein [Wenjunlia vitaminophila]